jgi:ribosome-associated heat shock protein Hsp15
LPNSPSSSDDRHCEERSDEAIQQRTKSGLLRSARNDEQVRIDRYLHCIRLVKSRTLAQSVLDTGYVRVDGKRVEKPSEEVRIGSTVALPLRGRVRVLRVLRLPERRGPAAEARSCYAEIDEGERID